jgi:hypothetical protein
MMFLTLTALFVRPGMVMALDKEAQLGTPAAYSSHPFNSYYYNERTQYLYTVSELQAAGLIAGQLTKIAFNFYQVQSYDYVQGMSIKMKNAATTAGLSATFDNVGFTTVYSNAGNQYWTSGWNTLTMTTPFVWNGTSNIIVEVCWGYSNWGGYVYNYSYNKAAPPSGYNTVYRNYDSPLYNGCSVATAAYASTYTANIKLTQPGGTISGVVRDAALNPLGGITITGGGGSTTTAPNGTYSMSVYAGTNNFTATGAGWCDNTQSATVPSGGSTTLNFTMLPPPTVEGIVTNAANGNPVNGAHITVSTVETYSVAGGTYSQQLTSLGTYVVTATKAGFDTYTTAPIAFTVPGAHVVVNIPLLETANTASQPFTAVLNSGNTAVNLNWGLPKGYYELIYDDGVKDTVTVWQVAGNMNAVKFTALNYPVTVIEGKVNIGYASSYPAGTDPTLLAPFQIQLYDATGPGGMPGNTIGDPIDIQPSHFGWLTFSLPNVNITSGNIYMVMIQGGNSANAAKLGVDLSSNQLRSYNRFVTGGGNWLPADGNFMMRLTVYGIGGPLASDLPEGILGYQVYRLFQGQEGVPGLWTSVATPTTNSTVDNSWPSLPDSAFRWAVKTKYTNNRWSDYIFSNVLGKNRTAAVVVTVSLTCAAHPLNGTRVTLACTMPGVDTVYTQLTDATGKATFPTVWKGPYLLTVSRIGYTTTSTNVSIYSDHTYDFTLLQEKVPPRNMFVDDLSLVSTWSPPSPTLNIFYDDFSTGFSGWSATYPWYIDYGTGNPAPSASLDWYSLYVISPYDDINLTSAPLAGVGSPQLALQWDINLDNWLASSTEYMEVEIQEVGGSWVTLKSYVNDASISWTTDQADISAYTNSNFNVRFRAHGSNAIYINYWYVDNVAVVATLPDPKPCILAYNVYLNGVLDGVTLDTTYTFPGSHVVFRQPYEACVKAVYGSGYSLPSCYDFVSQFLYPPTELVATAVECVAYLTWVKPQKVAKKVHVPAYKGTVNHTESFTGKAPVDMNNPKPSWPPEHSAWRGNIAFGFDASAGTCIDFDVEDIGGATTIGGLPGNQSWWHDVEFPPNVTDWAYCIGDDNDHLYTIERATLTVVDLGSIGASGNTILDLAADPTQPNFMYGVGYDGSGDNLFLIDPSGPSSTLIGSCVNSGMMIGLAGDAAGNIWGYDLVNDQFYNLDKTTGVANVVGSIGFGANYGQGMFYDKTGFGVTMAAFNADAFEGQIRAVDVTTGASTILSTTGDQIAGATLPVTGGGGGDPEGLIGYQIYRDGFWIDYVSGKDTTWYYDYAVNPGQHLYEVSAYYELTDYGYPGEHAESMLEGPDTVNIVCGRPLPFYEPWDNATFSYNDWDYEGNWSITTALGNPLPSADFSWIPPVGPDYSQSITTPTLNAGPYTCAVIWCDFDLKLVDRNATGKEKLSIDIYKDGGWKNVAEFANTGSFEWTPQHIELKQTMGKAFMVRWRANGENSQDLLHWYVDNINIYAICTPPTNLAWYDINDRDVYLSWIGPACASGPEPRWITWDDGTNADAIGTGGAANFDIAGRWTPDMISELDGGAVTKIRFWPASSGTANFSLRVWEGDLAGTLLVDEPIPGSSIVWDDWNEVSINNPVAIDINKELWIGLNVDATSGWPAGCDPGPAVTDFGDMIYFNGAWVAMSSAYGLDYNWDIEAYIEPAKGKAAHQPLKQTPHYNAGTLSDSPAPAVIKSGTPRSVAKPAASSLQGYNVYRSDDEKVTYHKLNSAIVSDTTYADMQVPYGSYWYFVEAVYAECNSDSSNLIHVDVVTGIDPLNNGMVSVYPNPATEVVNVKSDYAISQIEVMNYVGQTVYNKTNVDTKSAKIDVATFQSGVYFVKVTTSQGVRTVKITVTK